ncbi:MAG: ABC transporter ATP-binding protein [Verrucomicrobiaceae bacterium]|nr:ABC transporter ATP-binding protein [Verrucomicrobiaceae bacterium]
MPAPPPQPLVRVIDARKDYPLGHRTVHALRGVTLDIASHSFVVMQGPSGSGKTTLLNLIGCIDHPTSGSIIVAGQDTRMLGDTALSRFRARKLGFVFQDFNLIPVLTAMENVEYPLRLNAVPPSEARLRALAMLDAVGLAGEAGQRPSELSGGQCQRVAVARALVTQPELVIADEPTANLDSDTGGKIIEIMRAMCGRQGTTFLISTHDPHVAAHAMRCVHLRDGLITDA